MSRIKLILAIFVGLVPAWACGRTQMEPSGTGDPSPPVGAPTTLLAPTATPASSLFTFNAGLEPIEFGVRFDDNVYRSPYPNGKFSDEVYLLGAGGVVKARYDLFSGQLGYRLGAEQYQLYTDVSNLRNDFNLILDASLNPWSFYYKRDYYIRNSQYEEFNYIDDDSLTGLTWSPQGPWSFGAQYEYFTRTYYSSADIYRSENYLDNGIEFSVQREIDDKFSLKLRGSYNNREFDRNLVQKTATGFTTANDFPLQVDETWSVFLSAHIFFESILQDITIEQQRTNSNSYGFSNSVQSVSWAGVVTPVPSLYFQLFFRLYSKVYDSPPLDLPDLKVGFEDDEGQDLLALRGTWEWAPQWTASLGISRVRDESTQPGLYYIKNIISAQVKRSF